MSATIRRALVVDDEVIVSVLVEEILSENGFVVDIANTRAALDAALEQSRYAVIVSDTDLACAEEMQRWPTERLIVCSGKAVDELEREFPGTILVSKPFSDEQLVAAVQTTPGSRAPSI